MCVCVHVRSVIDDWITFLVGSNTFRKLKQSSYVTFYFWYHRNNRIIHHMNLFIINGTVNQKLHHSNTVRYLTITFPFIQSCRAYVIAMAVVSSTSLKFDFGTTFLDFCRLHFCLLQYIRECGFVWLGDPEIDCIGRVNVELEFCTSKNVIVY